jgi:hypothetical protein
MALTTIAELDLLNLLFLNSAMALIGDSTGLRPSSTAGNWYLSLHTADPGASGDQTTNEIAYTNYARVAITRDAAGWTVSGAQPAQAINAATVTFPACGATGGTATHFGIGTAASGAGKLVWKEALDSPLICTSGITPAITPGALKATCL